MYTRSFVALSALLCATVACSDEPEFGAELMPALGEPLSAAQIAELDYFVMPGGDGLPDGEGSATLGEVVYRSNCLACHGDAGEDGINDRLAGGHTTLKSERPVKTVGSFWPYATTILDYVRRAMPYQTPGALSNDELYSVTAYLLYINDVIDKDAVINQQNLPEIRMPNRDNFVWAYEPD